MFRGSVMLSLTGRYDSEPGFPSPHERTSFSSREASMKISPLLMALWTLLIPSGLLPERMVEAAGPACPG